MFLFYSYFSIILLLTIFSGPLPTLSQNTCSKLSKIGVDVERLEDVLFCGYDDELPPANPGVTITSIMIIYFESREDFYFSDTEFLQLDSLLVMKWSDERLMWNKQIFNSIDNINLESTDIWTPDFRYYRRRSTSLHSIAPLSHARVQSNGEITIVYPHSMVITCKTDTTNWPYDTQSCWFVYVSDYDIKIDNRGDLFDVTSRYTANNEWVIENITFEKKEWSELSHDKDLPVFKYHFLMTIKRLSQSQSVGIVVKCFVLMTTTLICMGLEFHSVERKLLCWLNFFSHLLCNEKIYYYYGYVGMNAWSGTDETSTENRSIYIFYAVSQYICLYSLISIWITKKIVTFDQQFSCLTAINIPTVLYDFLLHGRSFEDFSKDNRKSAQRLAKKIKHREWYLIGRILERLGVLTATLIYTYAFITLIPWQFIF